MADEEVDFSKLFPGDDGDDDMFYIDIHTVQKVLDEDDDCDFLEVGFSFSCRTETEIRNVVCDCVSRLTVKAESVIEP